MANNGNVLTDMIVVVPGILGSVLKYENQDVWNPSSAGFLGGRIRGLPLDRLKYSPNEPEGAVQATGLIRIPFGLRGLLASKGYDLLTDRLKQEFNVESYGNGCSNLHEFPYDWRQDNARSGERLKKFVDERLAAWRDETGNENARVIFLAHSMGGLVCRHFLDVLEGWRCCRLLVTFGTPFRGSLNAVQYLTDGYTVGRSDVTEAMLSMPSLYQLLPIYAAIQDGDKWTRPWASAPLQNVNPQLVAAAQEFHERLLRRVDENLQSADYRDHGYMVYPVVGIEQPTLQRARFNQTSVEYNDAMPDGFSALPRYGDGTVPHISAIPVEMKNPACLYVPERHAYLHANDRAMDGAIQTILTIQSGTLEKARGVSETRSITGRPAFSLNATALDAEKKIRVAVEHRHVNATAAVFITVRDLGGAGTVVEERLASPDAAGLVTLDLAVPAAGCYEVEVRAANETLHAPPHVRDLVELL